MRSNKETVELWQGHVEAYRNSGQTRRAYCQENGIRVYQLDYWRRRLKSLRTKTTTNLGTDWVAVQICEEPPANQSSRIRLRVERFSIESGSGVNPDVLSQMLRAIGTVC